MHGLAILTAIEAVLVALAYLLARGDWSRTCLYLLGVTAPLEGYRTTVADVNVSLFRISLALALATIAVLRVAERRGRDVAPERRGTAVMRIGAAYALLAAVVGASFAVHGEVLFLGWRLLAVLLAGVVVIAVCVELARRTSVSALATAVVAGMVLPVLASFWQVAGPRVGERGELPLLASLPLEDVRAPGASLLAGGDPVATRLEGTFLDANHFGLFLLFTLAVATALAVEALLAQRAARAVGFAALAVASLATLVATYSRSAWGAAVLAAALMPALLAPLLRGRIPPRHRRLAAVAAVGCVALVVAPLGAIVAARANVGSAVNLESNTLHRVNFEGGARVFADNPVVGVGVGKLGEILGQEARMSGADSTYLTVAAELGAVGLLALALAAGLALQALAVAYRRSRAGPGAVLPAALIAAYLGFLVANVFYDQLWWRDYHFVVVGLIAALSARHGAPGDTPARP